MDFDDFIGQVQNQTYLCSIGDAVKATRAVLETLAERITLDEVKDLAVPAIRISRKGRVGRILPVNQPAGSRWISVTQHACIMLSVQQNAVARGRVILV